MGAQPHPIGIGDADPGRGDVVGHPGELVDAVDLELFSSGPQRQPHRSDILDPHRATAGPGIVRQCRGFQR